jgi:hypothetical protein
MPRRSRGVLEGRTQISTRWRCSVLLSKQKSSIDIHRGDLPSDGCRAARTLGSGKLALKVHASKLRCPPHVLPAMGAEYAKETDHWYE